MKALLALVAAVGISTVLSKQESGGPAIKAGAPAVVPVEMSKQESGR